MPDNAEVHLANAPIVEAVIAFQCSFGNPRDAAWIEAIASRFGDEVAAEYPTKEPTQQARFTFNGKTATAHHETIGYRFRNIANNQVIQVHAGGFAFSRLRPYENWNMMRSEAARQWNLFKSMVGDLKIESSALRYINKISIPANSLLSEYFSMYPMNPPGLFAGAANYLLRSEGRMQNPDCIAVLQQLQLPNESPSEISIVIDNDFKIEAADLTEQDVWQGLEELRKLKNRVFFQLLTKRALEMFT